MTQFTTDTNLLGAMGRPALMGIVLMTVLFSVQGAWAQGYECPMGDLVSELGEDDTPACVNLQQEGWSLLVENHCEGNLTLTAMDYRWEPYDDYGVRVVVPGESRRMDLSGFDYGIFWSLAEGEEGEIPIERYVVDTPPCTHPFLGCDAVAGSSSDAPLAALSLLLLGLRRRRRKRR